jgi:polyhydroxyalkanoate synthesis regulator phasin
MFNAIKQTVFAGIGAAVVTREKAGKVFDELVAQGKINAADAQKAARKLAVQGEKEFKIARAEVETKLRRLAAEADAANRARIAELEAELAALKKKASPARAKRRSSAPRA